MADRMPSNLMLGLTGSKADAQLRVEPMRSLRRTTPALKAGNGKC